jgi:hypothetical protein
MSAEHTFKRYNNTCDFMTHVSDGFIVWRIICSIAVDFLNPKVTSIFCPSHRFFFANENFY